MTQDIHIARGSHGRTHILMAPSGYSSRGRDTHFCARRAPLRVAACPVECFVSVSAACGDAVRGGLRSRVGRVASHGRVVGTRTHVKDSPLTTRTTQQYIIVFVVALCVFQDPTGVRKIPWMTYEK